MPSLGAPQARQYFQPGKWYHIAYCWRFDPAGNKSRFNWYVNGRRKAHYTWDNGIPRNLAASVLDGAAGTTMRFGGGSNTYAPFPGGVPDLPGGEVYDELRVSKRARYYDPDGVPLDDFTPPTKAFADDDPDTFILMHFDGDYNALVNNNPTPVAASTTDTNGAGLLLPP